MACIILDHLDGPAPSPPHRARLPPGSSLGGSELFPLPAAIGRRTRQCGLAMPACPACLQVARRREADMAPRLDTTLRADKGTSGPVLTDGLMGFAYRRRGSAAMETFRGRGKRVHTNARAGLPPFVFEIQNNRHAA